MEFNIVLDELDGKTYVTINRLTENEVIANREVEEIAYIEIDGTMGTNKEHIIDVTLNELKNQMENTL